MGRAVGIDLGTTCSTVAVVDGGKPVVIPDGEGSRTTPSVVAFAAGGERLVGQIARRQLISNPENTVTAVKRLIGRKLADDQVKQHLATCSYRVVAAENGDCRVLIHGRQYSPVELSATTLSQLKKAAEDYLSEPVTDAVITVPACFDHAQRQATKDAGRIAGLNVLRILNEPTAAALAYGAERGPKERVAVYDLGGGTFDISLLELSRGLFEVRATSGDTCLGGEDFDRRIIDWLAVRFREQYGMDLRHNKLARQRLKEAAERARQALSTSLTTEINLPLIAADDSGPRHLVAELSRDRLDLLVGDLVERSLERCSTALADAGSRPGDIEQVILVGGLTRMPRVRAAVEGFFGRQASRRVDPDEVVAVGAAIQAAILRGEMEQMLLLDVTPLSLGVETSGGAFTAIIPRNAAIPTRAAEVFSTAVDNQSFVEVHLVQGERPMTADNKSLARFQLLGIPPAPRGVPQIEVAFDIDPDGIVSVSARDLGTGREQRVRVVPTSGLTEVEIERIVAEPQAPPHRLPSPPAGPSRAPRPEQASCRLSHAVAMLTDVPRRAAHRLIEVAAAQAARVQRVGGARTALRAGEVALERRELPLAIAWLAEALRLDPDNGKAMALRAWAQVMAGQATLSDLVPDFEEAVLRAKKVARAHYYLGMARKHAGDRYGAISSFRRAIELDQHLIEAASELRVLHIG
jgi:molecular chaperone DnaK